MNTTIICRCGTRPQVNPAPASDPLRTGMSWRCEECDANYFLTLTCFPGAKVKRPENSTVSGA